MLIQKGSPFPNLSAFTTYLQASTVQTQMTSDPKAKFPSHHAPPAGREAGPFCNPLLPETFPRTRRCSEPAAARASPRQTTHTLPPTSPRQSSDPYLPPQRTNLSPKHKWGNFKRDHRAAPHLPDPAPRSHWRSSAREDPAVREAGEMDRAAAPRPPGNSVNFQGGAVRRRGQPPPQPRGGALREAARDGPSPRPPAAAASATAPAAPGPAPGHPAPTARRRAPPFPRGPSLPGARPAPSLAPAPGAPRAPLLGGAAPPPRNPAPQRPPSQRDPTPSPAAAATATTSPQPTAPSPGLRSSRRARTRRSPGPARHSTPRRPEPPPSARDSPGHPRTDPHTGAIFRSQASARPELVLRGARAHCAGAAVSLRRPCLSLPLGFLSFFSLQVPS